MKTKTLNKLSQSLNVLASLGAEDKKHEPALSLIFKTIRKAIIEAKEARQKKYNKAKKKIDRILR
jgi:hypothetical protein